jgi:2-polyprenyl-3-methyl-5-hydroxy-6-metoxy-1,4-benzoquinol methylase
VPGAISNPSQRTFRDPAGSVQIRPEGVFREVHPAYSVDLLVFLNSPLAARLVSAGHLIASEVSPPDRHERPATDQPLLLIHPRVSFPSYPWEWSPALWLAAADLTLTLCTDLLEDGLILKDATPFNVLFRGVEPVFVDILSIQPADLRQPIWFAYGQFIRTFLLPMLAHTQLGWPLQVALTRRDGIEPEELYAALPWTQRLRQPALSAVTLPMLLSKSPKASSPQTRTVEDPELTRHILRKTLAALQKRMLQSTPTQGTSAWSEYVHTANHYSAEDHAAKASFVREALAAARPAHVLDVGCNTGVYSRLAAQTGAEVVSIDTDLAAVDRLCNSLKGSGLNILPLCVNLAHPSPATGWQNGETLSFLARCSGHFDTVMMLAVLHHLLLQSQIPLEQIAALAARLTTCNLILEWVPPTDTMFQQLLRGREAIYAHLTEANFRTAFAEHFEIVSEHTLSNHRILFHLRKSSLPGASDRHASR